MSIELGMQLPHVVLRWAANAEQVFSLQALNADGEPITWGVGDELVLVIAGDELSASLTAGGYATWTLTAEQSDPAYLGRSLRLEYRADDNVYLWGAGTVRAA